MFKLIAIAGTFDRLHKGHRFFISETFKRGEKVIIGLTSDDYAKRKLQIGRPLDDYKLQIKSQIQNYQIRKKELENFLKEKGLSDRAEIVEIDDVYGPAADDNGIEALVVTGETIQGARLVNRRRKEKGLSLLKVVKVLLIPAEDRKRITSTRIRLGEIDRWGRVYEKLQIGRPLDDYKLQINKKDRYKILEELRQELKRPQGILIKGNPENHRELELELKKIIAKLQPVMISTVGDEVTKLCNQVGIKPNLAIIDYHVMRQRKYNSLGDLGFPSRKAIKTPRGWQADPSDDGEAMTPPMVKESILTVKNPPGNITKTLVMAVKKSIKNCLSTGKQQIIKVIGEEDLAGLPAMLLSPLGSVVIYGQPNEGVVVMEITEEKKQQLLGLIQKYS